MTAEPAFETTVTGIPLWLLREYLEELGGRARPDGGVSGEGWTVRLTQVSDYQIGSLRVGRVHLEVSGEGEAVDHLRAVLRKKLLRAGG